MKNSNYINKIFNFILLMIFIIVFLFLSSPIIILLINGVPAVSKCLKSKEVLFAITLSLKTSLISTSLCILLGIPTAYFIYSRLILKKLITQILYIPMSLPHIVSGIGLLILFGRLGIGSFLSEYFKIDFIFTKQGIVLAQIFVNLPFAIKLLVVSFENISQKTLFVSRTLGCNKFQVFYYIILPLLKNGLLSAVIMIWCRALGEYGAVLMVAGTTKMKTEIIPTSIMLNMSTGDLDLAIGISSILIIISVTCMILFEYLFNNKKKEEIYVED